MTFNVSLLSFFCNIAVWRCIILIYSPRTSATHKPTSHKDLLDTSSSDSSSDDSTLRSMSPFSEAFVSSMLQHHREGGSDTAPNGEANDQPRNNVTMTELIARRKQQDLKRSLGRLHLLFTSFIIIMVLFVAKSSKRLKASSLRSQTWLWSTTLPASF